MMDAGKASELPTEVAGKRLPSWLRPDHVPTEQWGLMRPDILIIRDLDAAKLSESDPLERERTISEVLANKNMLPGG